MACRGISRFTETNHIRENFGWRSAIACPAKFSLIHHRAWFRYISLIASGYRTGYGQTGGKLVHQALLQHFHKVVVIQLCKGTDCEPTKHKRTCDILFYPCCHCYCTVHVEQSSVIVAIAAKKSSKVAVGSGAVSCMAHLTDIRPVSSSLCTTAIDEKKSMLD